MTTTKPTTTRGQALAALDASAGPDGAPRFSAIARAIGVPRTTLRRWWRERPVEATAPPLTSPNLGLTAKGDRRSFLEALLDEATDALTRAKAAGAWPVVAMLMRQVLELRDEIDKTPPAPRKSPPFDYSAFHPDLAAELKRRAAAAEIEQADPAFDPGLAGDGPSLWDALIRRHRGDHDTGTGGSDNPASVGLADDLDNQESS